MIWKYIYRFLGYPFQSDVLFLGWTAKDLGFNTLNKQETLDLTVLRRVSDIISIKITTKRNLKCSFCLEGIIRNYENVLYSHWNPPKFSLRSGPNIIIKLNF